VAWVLLTQVTRKVVILNTDLMNDTRLYSFFVRNNTFVYVILTALWSDACYVNVSSDRINKYMYSIDCRILSAFNIHWYNMSATTVQESVHPRLLLWNSLTQAKLSLKVFHSSGLWSSGTLCLIPEDGPVGWPELPTCAVQHSQIHHSGSPKYHISHLL
jgi:hypothetical protein